MSGLLSKDDGLNLPINPNADDSMNGNIDQVVMSAQSSASAPAPASAEAEETAPGSNGHLITPTSQPDTDTDGLPRLTRELSDPNLILYLAYKQLETQVDDSFNFQMFRKKYDDLESMNMDEAELTTVCKNINKFINDFEAFISDALDKISRIDLPPHIPITYEEVGVGTETDPRCRNATYDPLIPQKLDQNNNQQVESHMPKRIDNPEETKLNQFKKIKQIVKYAKKLDEFTQRVTCLRQIADNTVESLNKAPITRDTLIRQSLVDEILGKLHRRLDILNKDRAEELQKFQKKVGNIHMLGKIHISGIPGGEAEIVDQSNAGESMDQVVQHPSKPVEEKKLKKAKYNQVLKELTRYDSHMSQEMKSIKMAEEKLKDWVISGQVVSSIEAVGEAEGEIVDESNAGESMDQNIEKSSNSADD